MTKARDLANIANGVPNSLITLDANEIPNLDTAKITTGTFDSARINNASLSAITALPSGVGGTAWQSVQTSAFTAVAGRGYPCNTTSSAFTVTLPASATAGDTIQLVDYSGTFATNALTLGRNSLKIEGGTDNKRLTTNREAVTLTYVDATQGWVASSGTNFGSQSLDPVPYSVDFLVIAGGGGGGSTSSTIQGGGGGGSGGYRNSFSTETSGGGGSSEASLTFSVGVVYTVTVGAGGAGGSTPNEGSNGVNSSISGTGISTITSTGGGGGCNIDSNAGVNSGGSGGGAGSGGGTSAGGSGTANQGFAGGANTGATFKAGGGGGAGAVGKNDANNGDGGAGLASSITGSSVTRAGGGGGGPHTNGNTQGLGGSGGGGNSGISAGAGTAGTTNTGSGGGGGADFATGGAGGSGVVILRIPTANYSGTTTGSPTVTTDGSDKVIVFNASGSITG